MHGVYIYALNENFILDKRVYVCECVHMCHQTSNVTYVNETFTHIHTYNKYFNMAPVPHKYVHCTQTYTPVQMPTY